MQSSEPTPTPKTGPVFAQDPHERAFIDDPYAFYRKAHTEDPVFFWSDYGYWCFAGWDDVNALLRDRRFGRQILHKATRAELGWPPARTSTPHFDQVDAYSLLALEGPAHTRLRTLVNRAFVSRQVERLRPEIETLANGLVDRFEARGEAELIADFSAPIPVIIIADMLGVPTEMGQHLLDWSHRMVRMFMHEPDAEVERDADAAARDFIAYLHDLMAQKRKNPGHDLISYMLTTEHRGERISDDELISTAILLLNAGHEATVHQAGNAIRAILASGHDPRSLFASPEKAEATVEEALRFDAPLHLFTRYALEDVRLDNGLKLKKGEEIALLLGAANRDPKRFANPDNFDPERTDGANVSFGAGIHFCIGAPLARLELQTALKILFDRLPTLRLSAEPRYMDAYLFHGLERLDVSW